MGRPFKCPYCGATESVSKGVRKTKTMGIRSIRRCGACHRKFTPKSQKPRESARTKAGIPREASEPAAGSANPQSIVMPPDVA